MNAERTQELQAVLRKVQQTKGPRHADRNAPTMLGDVYDGRSLAKVWEGSSESTKKTFLTWIAPRGSGDLAFLKRMWVGTSDAVREEFLKRILKEQRQ